MVRLKNVSLTESLAEAVERWQGHFAEVFRGQIVPLDHMRETISGTHAADAMLDVGPVATAAAFAKLGNNKAVGPDDIPAELLKAGGDALACKFAEVNQRTARGLSWPIQWRGGRLANIHMLKGDPSAG